MFEYTQDEQDHLKWICADINEGLYVKDLPEFWRTMAKKSPFSELYQEHIDAADCGMQRDEWL